MKLEILFIPDRFMQKLTKLWDQRPLYLQLHVSWGNDGGPHGTDKLSGREGTCVSSPPPLEEHFYTRALRKNTEGP